MRFFVNKNKLSLRYWSSFIFAGLIGQFAWAVENNFLNLFVVDASHSTMFIPIMTAASAAVATLTTIFIGVLSDRLGKRKIFISCGYIVWGITIIAFAFIMPNNGELSYFPIGLPITGNVLVISGTLIVIMDCVMTFFGSTSNDACFNAYVTEKTNNQVRTKVESVLSVLPLLAIIVTLFLQSTLVRSSEHKPYWDIFFFMLGGITIVSGIIFIFLLPDDQIKPNKSQSYAQNLVHGFKPSVIKQNPILYLSLVGFLIFNMAVQVFSPYLMVYIEKTLGIQNEQFTLTIGLILGIASVLTVGFGLFVDKIGKNKVMIPAIAVAIVGGIIMFFVTNQIGVILGGIVLFSGHVCGTAVLGAKIRDCTPESEAGLLQGVRMVFVILIPMVTGPYIGQGVSYIDARYYEDGSLLPNKFVFLFASIVFLFAVPVIIYMIKKEKELATAKPVKKEISTAKHEKK